MKTLIALTILAINLVSAGEDPAAPSRESKILAAILRHVLLDKTQESARDFYGTKGDRTVVLLNGGIRWPEGFVPKVKGFTFVLEPPMGIEVPENSNRRLAIRLDRFDLVFPPKPKAELGVIGEKSPIEVTIMNGGGAKNGAVIGGQTTWYTITKNEGEWTAEFVGLLD